MAHMARIARAVAIDDPDRVTHRGIRGADVLFSSAVTANHQYMREALRNGI